MNRRSFFKVVTGFVAGVVGASAKSNPQPKTLTCGGKNGTLCPRCKFNDCHFPNYCSEVSTSIDPNSEWAKQKYLTLDEIIKIDEELRYEIFGFRKV